MKKIMVIMLALCMLLSAAVAEESEAGVLVYVTIAAGDLVMAQAPVELSDTDGDGMLTINDALYLAHEEFYEGGAEAGYATAETQWGLSLAKLWGVENGGSYGYYVNNVSANSMADELHDGDHLNAFAYTDSCLGAFVDRLKASPLWDSLLVVILPDHGITYPGVHSTADLRVSHIPMLWVGGALAKHGEYDMLLNQSDLAATLLAQMGVDISDFTFSRNVFSPSFPQRRRFAMHADKNGVTLIQPDGHWVYDCVSRTLQPASEPHLRFVEASLQRLYQTTAALPRQARGRQ